MSGTVVAIGAPSVWRHGAGAPSNSLGNNGDYYLNDTTYDVYYKSADTYSVVVNIKGADGADGPQGDPGSAIGYGAAFIVSQGNFTP